jgi:hypothetical protein
MYDEDQEQIICIGIELILINFSKSRFVHEYDDETLLLILLSLLYIREFSLYSICSCSKSCPSPRWASAGDIVFRDIGMLKKIIVSLYRIL